MKKNRFVPQGFEEAHNLMYSKNFDVDVSSGKQPTLRDIVNNYIMPAHMHNGIDKQAEAEQAIKSLMLSKLPEKKYVSEDEDPAKAYDDLVHQGYNQAIEEITKTIKEI